MGMGKIPKGYSPAIRRTIGLEKKQISYIAKNTKLTYMQVVSRINDMLKKILYDLKFQINQWIDFHVPKRTGQLRRALKKSLNNSEVKWGMLKLIIGTRLHYADEVNAMRAATVRHFNEWGYAYYGGHHGKILLNDPQAVGAFFDTLLGFIQERSHTILSQAIAEFFGGRGTLPKYVRSKIK